MTGSQGSQGDPGSQVFDQLQIPGADFYPESITSDAAGNIYTGSLVTGEIVKFAPFDDTPMVLHAAGADGIVGVAGVLADSTNSKLWICSVDFTFANPTQVAELNLATGALIQAFDMPTGAGAFCNDLALDAAGNLYVTDSFGTVAKLPAGGTTLTTWAQDDRWTPAAQGEFTVDGIAIDGTTLYVNLLSDPAVYPTAQAALFTVDITNTGDAGTITQLNVSAGASDVPLSGADGMRLDGHDLIIVEPSGNLWDFAIASGNADGILLSNRLYQPSAVTQVGSELWVAEGEIPTLLSNGDGPPPRIPFLIERVHAP
jgi:hypothetical protein